MTTAPHAREHLNAPNSADAGARHTSRLLRESALLYGSVYVFVFFKFVAGFVVAKLLGPGLYGLRSALGLAVDYEPYAQLGTFEAMQKEVPRHRGSGDHRTADRILSGVFTANLLQSLFLSVALFAAALYLQFTTIDRIYVDFLLFLGAYAVVNRISTFYTALLVVDKRTNVLSQFRMLHAALSAALSVVLVYYLSLRGLFIGLLAAQAVALAFLAYRVAWIPPLRVSGHHLWQLVRIGFPIMLITLLFMLFRSVDRILILGMLSTEMLGYFAVGVIVSALVFESIGDVFRVMFFPRLMERIGRSVSTEELRRQLVEPTILVAYFAPLLMGALYLAVHLPLVHFAPEYLPAVGVARILTLAQFFFAVATVPLLVCVALNKQNGVVLLTALAIALNAALTYTFIRMGWGLDGVALGTGLSYCAFSVAVTAFALREFDRRWWAFFRLYGLVLVPFAYAAVLLYLEGLWLPWQPTSFLEDLGLVLLKIGLFCALYGPLLLAARSHPAFERLLWLVPRGRRK